MTVVPKILHEAEVPQECRQGKKSTWSIGMKILFFISTAVSIFEIYYCVEYGCVWGIAWLQESRKASFIGHLPFIIMLMGSFALIFSLLTFIVGMLLGKKLFVKQVLVVHGIFIALLSFGMFYIQMNRAVDDMDIISIAVLIIIVVIFAQQIGSIIVKYFYYKKLLQKINNQKSLTSLSGLNMFVDANRNPKITWVISFLIKILLVGEVYVCFCFIAETSEVNFKPDFYWLAYVPALVLVLSAIWEILSSSIASVRTHLFILGCCYCLTVTGCSCIMTQLTEFSFYIGEYWWFPVIGSLYLTFHLIHYLSQRARYIDNFGAVQRNSGHSVEAQPNGQQ